MEDKVIANLTDESGNTKGIRLKDFNGMEATADADSNGRLKFITDYRDANQPPPRHEDGTVEACGLLILKLNQSGDHWVTVERHTGPEVGVDCKAKGSDGKSELLMSVTRVGTGEFREQLGRQQLAGNDLPTAKLTEHILAAITRKALRDGPAQRCEKMLVLDAHDVPGYTATPVIRRFRQHHSSETADYMYQAVWIVGPSLDFVHRLDVPEVDQLAEPGD